MIRNGNELIENNYRDTLYRSCDIQPYQEMLSRYAMDCNSVTEMGIGPLHLGLNSTWCLLHGLLKSKGSNDNKKYIAIDLIDENTNILNAKEISESVGINFEFIVSNTIEIEIDKTDLLFIDTDHRYQHLMKELELHNENVSKYIIIHDTSGKYENWEDWPFDHENRGELKNNPNKYGLWPCVVDFIDQNPNWKLLERGQEGNGMTVLQRIK